MKLLSLLVMIAAVFAIEAAAQRKTLKPADLKILEGRKWTGTLTYLDYSSGKPTSIKCDLKITRDKKNPRVWIFEYEYPDEPKANSRSELILSSDGRTFDGETVVEFDDLRGIAGPKLVTTTRGTDNDKPATFRRTYYIGNTSFWITKEVKLDGSDKYFERNRYQWSRPLKTR